MAEIVGILADVARHPSPERGGGTARSAVGEVSLLQPHGPGGRTQEAGDQPEQGRLAGAVGTGDGQQLASAKREGEVGENQASAA